MGGEENGAVVGVRQDDRVCRLKRSGRQKQKHREIGRMSGIMASSGCTPGGEPPRIGILNGIARAAETGCEKPHPDHSCTVQETAVAFGTAQR